MATPKKTAVPKASPAAQPSAPAYEFHPYADLLPKMSKHEFQDLKKGIQASGQQEPITLYQGKVLDGRHRLRACQELGIEPQFQEVELADDQAALDFVIARNLQRRNLTASQKAVVALRALPHIKEDVRKARVQKIRDAIAANRLDGKGANLPPSDSPSSDSPLSDLPPPEEAKARRGRKKTVKTTSIVGDLFGVSATYVRYAEALEKKDKKLLDQVIVDGKRLYDLYKQECPQEARGRTKHGPKANPIRTGLKRLIRLVEKSSDMPAVLRKLKEALADLDVAQKAEVPAKGEPGWSVT